MTFTPRTNYIIFRGKCYEACLALQKVLPDLELVRGWYNTPTWDRDSCQHWWLKTPQGDIVDPTALQFPNPNVKEWYEEFDGVIYCSECGEEIEYTDEEEIIFMGNYPVCSDKCARSLVGI